MSDLQKGEKHLTVSAWIVTKTTPRKILLIHHKKFNKWIQPGGHVDFGENPVEAIIREVKEETGIEVTDLSKQILPAGSESSFLPLPSFFMEQKIPEYNDQPEHFHLDVMYVIEVEEQEVTKNTKESHDIQWFTLDETMDLPMHENTGKVVKKLLSS